MIGTDRLDNLVGCTLYAGDGEKVGRVGQVFLDNETNRPEWVTVNTGLFGLKESFVPLQEAELADDRLTVPYKKDEIKDAPNVDVDGGQLDPSQEVELYRHYGLSYREGDFERQGDFDRGSFDREDAGGTAGRDLSGRSADDAMTRSEERLDVGTEREEVGRARLRKYVVTENVQKTVPVTREEVRVEREPITDDNIDRATSGPDISEGEHEVTIHAERPVVQKETVPVERVRLTKDAVQDEETISDEVRREEIDADVPEGAEGRSRRGRRRDDR